MSIELPLFQHKCPAKHVLPPSFHFTLLSKQADRAGCATSLISKSSLQKLTCPVFQLALIRNAQFSALQHLVIPHNRLAGTYGHELRISLHFFRSLKSITVLVSYDIWFALRNVPGSHVRSDRRSRINVTRLQDIKDGVDQMIQGIMRTSTIWNAIGAPKVELLCGEWPGYDKMVFPEREEDEKWRPKEVKVRSQSFGLCSD